jgi:arginine/lysine/ornithine decarboxylase
MTLAAPTFPADRASLHEAAPLYESLHDFVAREQAPFYSPGHKGGRTLDPWFRSNIAAIDLNNLPDTDTLHCPTGPIMEAERLIADAWGVSRSFMLVQGSTAGNIAMAIATLRPGDTVLVQRNAHKSVVAGLVQSGALPVWLSPDLDRHFGIAHGLTAAEVERAFVAHAARALWILHPTYYGSVADVAALAAICHRHGALLLADGAHSPHFAFHPDLPAPAEVSGAAATVQSIHKILSGLSQAAVLHIDAARVEEAAVRRALQLIQTTSPHFAIMASIDLARREMACNGERLLSRALALARHLRSQLAATPGVSVLGPSENTGPGSGFTALDETKILIGVDDMDGREVVRILNRDFGVQPELGGRDHVLCILTIGNTERDIERLAAAVATIAGRSRRKVVGSASPETVLPAVPKVVMSPREAFFAVDEAVALGAAVGRIAAEVVTPYPPGIPVLMPGERVTSDIVDGLRAVLWSGTPVSASDPTLATMKVIK